MSHIVADRVVDSTSTTGTSSFVLDADPPTGYRSISEVCANGDTIWYTAQHRLLDQWEVGKGTYAAGTGILARTQILASSNAGSIVNFSAGAKDLVCGLPASQVSLLASPLSLTTLSLADDTADWLQVYDTSASEWKKTLGQNLGFTQAGTGATLRSLQSKLREIFSVKDFGAVGDGVTNEAAAFTATIAAWQASSTGGMILIPPGTYAFGSQVTWPKSTTKPLIVSGPGAVITNVSGVTDAVWYVGSNSVAGGAHLITLRDLQFTGTSTSTSRALYLENANGAILENCRFKTHQIPAELNASYAVSFESCQWEAHSLYGIVCGTTAAHNLVVVRSNFFGPGQGIRVTQSTHNPVIRDCSFEGCSVPVQFDAGGAALIFEGNYCEYSTDGHLHFGATMTAPSIRGNWFGESTNGWTLQNVVGGVFDANSLYNLVAVAASSVVGMYDGAKSLTGTASWTNSGSGLRVAAASGIAQTLLQGSGTETTQFLNGRTISIKNLTAGASVVANQQIGSIGFVNDNNVAVAGVTAHYTNNADGASAYLSFKADSTADLLKLNSASFSFLSGVHPQPATNDGSSIGISGKAFSDLYLATGARIDMGAGNMVLTHSAGLLALTGGPLKLTGDSSAAGDAIRLDTEGASQQARMLFSDNGTPYWLLHKDTDQNWKLYDAIGARTVFQFNSNGGAYFCETGGISCVIGNSVLTTATSGFLYVPTCAGTPTGTPGTNSGRAPIVIDTTNNKLYFYSGGAWRDAGP